MHEGPPAKLLWQNSSPSGLSVQARKGAGLRGFGYSLGLQGKAALRTMQKLKFGTRSRAFFQALWVILWYQMARYVPNRPRDEGLGACVCVPLPHHISSAVCLQSLHYTAMHDHNTWRDFGFSVCVPCSRSSAKFGLAYMRNKATASVLNRRTSELHAAGRGAHQCCLAQGIHRNLSQFVRGTEQVQEDSAWVLAPLWAFEDVRKIDFRHLCSQKPAERTALAMTVCQPQHGKTRHLPSPPLGALKRRSPLGLCSSFGSVCAHVAQIMPAC